MRHAGDTGAQFQEPLERDQVADVGNGPDIPLDVRDQFRDALHLIENCAVIELRQEPAWVTDRELSDIWRLEVRVRVLREKGPAIGRLAALPRPGQGHGGKHLGCSDDPGRQIPVNHHIQDNSNLYFESS